MTQAPSGTVTFLFTDIEGSTALWERWPTAMKEALARHDDLVRQAVEAHGGHVFKTGGDAFYVAFSDVGDALRSAIAAQRAIRADESWGELGPLRVRAAVHTGAVEERDGDYFGPTLNRSARLLSAAHGGQILVSNAARSLVASNMPADIVLRDLGEHRLRDLSQPERIWQLAADGLGADFPAPHTLETHPHNLPVRLTSFVGREREVTNVGQQLAESRLVTLIGFGGAGKTSLALQVAATALDNYPNGVWLVPLASIQDPAMVIGAVAATLGVHEDAGQPLDRSLHTYVRDRRLLLVLDNCEHLVDACAQLIISLLMAGPELRVLATSRERLAVPGEQVFGVPPLGLPKERDKASVVEILASPAIQLFQERAAAARRDFRLDDESATAALRVCERLDGIPLAIELAAARVSVLSVPQIAARLNDRFRLLAGRTRTELPHHQTLRATIDWSYNLLAEPERALFDRLSVFRGGWSLTAAEAVCADDQVAAWEVLDLVAELEAKSLAVVEEHPDENRYHLLESLREYAAERLAAPGKTEALQRRHLAWALGFAHEAHEHLQGAEQAEWLSRLGLEHDNMRAALEYAVQLPAPGDPGEVPPALQLAGTLARFWQTRGDYTEGRGWLERALAAPGAEAATAARADALDGAGQMAREQNDYAAARSFHEESLEIRRALGDEVGIAQALNDLGNNADKQGRLEEARAFHEESLAMRRKLGNTYGVGASLNNLAALSHHAGDFETARLLYEESLATFRGLDETWAEGVVLGNLGEVALDREDYGAARSLFEEGLVLYTELGDRSGIAKANTGLALAALGEGQPTDARRHFQEAVPHLRDLEDSQMVAEWLEGVAALAQAEGDPVRAVRMRSVATQLREATKTPVLQKDAARNASAEAALRGELGDTAYDAAWSAGRTLAWERALNEGLAAAPGSIPVAGRSRT